jgi:hypothetical protein
MDLDLPLYALQRTAPNRWSVLSPNADPFLPAVHAVAVLEDMTMKTTIPMRTRGQINNIDLRSDLIEVARLLDHLAPDRHDPELYFLRKDALVHELRRLAHWARHVR